MTHDALVSAVRGRNGKSWCLFLDRDGVINTRIMGGYVRDWAEFVFAPGALEALATLARWAPRVVVVTNQQGIGKALMSEDDLAGIHERMHEEVVAAQGRIDAVEFCPHLADNECDCRKPRPGMATRYLDAHPDIDGSLSMLVGDTPSDVEMGRRLAAVTGGCVTVRIDEREDALADVTFASLADFADAVEEVLAAEAGLAVHSPE